VPGSAQKSVRERGGGGGWGGGGGGGGRGGLRSALASMVTGQFAKGLEAADAEAAAKDFRGPTSKRVIRAIEVSLSHRSL